MKNKITLLLSILISNIMLSQTTLSAGDIAIIQYNASGNPEVIKFLALTSMESGTTINFTDNGWITTGTPAFRTGEANTPHTWTAPSAVSCGDIVTVSIPNGSFNLSTSGDQIFAYQGVAATPTFIFGMNNKGNKWQPTASSSTTSGIPSTLTDGVNAVAIQKVNNVIYSGSLTGSKSIILGNICNKANWTTTTSSTTPQNFTGVFTSEINWNTSWSGTGTPSDYFKAIIHEDYDTSTDGDFTVCEVQVNSTKTLTVNSGGTVTVENNITNNGTILVESGGSVVQKTKDGVNTGTTYTVERTTTLQSSSHVFTYWSTPITTATFADVASDAHLYYSFNASSQSWTLGSSSTSMSPGIGYAMEGPDSGATYPGAQSASFTGAPFNNGDIDVALSFSADADADNDWNLIGNPYPSAILANTFLTDNSSTIGGTIYFWTHNTIEDGTTNNTEDDYAMYNTMGGTTAVSGGTQPDGNIASGQGFFAQALSSGTTTLFTNDMRISGNNTSFFRNTDQGETEGRNRIWLNLTSETSFSQLLIGFTKGATDGVDRKYDGLRFSGNSLISFYSIINDEHYGIQGKPPLKELETIPLGFSANKTGEFKIAIDKIEGVLEGSDIYLVDNFLDIQHNLKTSDYIFSVVELGEFNNRFYLGIETEASVLNVEETETLKNILIHNYKNSIVIKTLDNSIIKKVLIYDLLGKKIITKENSSSSLKIESSILKSNSVFVIKIALENGEFLIKKFYKN